MPGTCKQCGTCCRVLTLEQSPETVRATAAIASVLGIPSDAVFAAKHWHPLTREEALRRNPFYASRLAPDAYLYCCDRLGDDDRCQVYDERPLVCRGYPWYSEPPRNMPLPHPNCGYAIDQESGESRKSEVRSQKSLILTSDQPSGARS